LASQKTVIGLSVGVTESWRLFGSLFFQARALLGLGWHVVMVWLLGTMHSNNNHGQRWQYSHGQLDTVGVGDLKWCYTIFYM